MAEAIVSKRSASGTRLQPLRKRAGWVRKNVVMDQRKLDVARRALGVDTETEAIDQALDFIAFREELTKGFIAVRRSGGVDDVLERRRKGDQEMRTTISFEGALDPHALRARMRAKYTRGSAIVLTVVTLPSGATRMSAAPDEEPTSIT